MKVPEASSTLAPTHAHIHMHACTHKPLQASDWTSSKASAPLAWSTGAATAEGWSPLGEGLPTSCGAGVGRQCAGAARRFSRVAASPAHTRIVSGFVSSFPPRTGLARVHIYSSQACAEQRRVLAPNKPGTDELGGGRCVSRRQRRRQPTGCGGSWLNLKQGELGAAAGGS
jgi:hypothetical protein